MEDKSINFQRLPLITIDGRHIVKYKNAAFEQISSIRLGTKVEKILSPEAVAELELSVQSNKINAISYNGTEGYNFVLSLPMQDKETALVFLPSIYSAALSNGKSELVNLIARLLTSDKTDEKIAKKLVKIRKALYRNFEHFDDSFSQRISVSTLIKIATSQFRLCAFSLGVRFNLQDNASEGLHIKANMKALATELLCLLDIALYIDRKAAISFEVSTRFDRLHFTFSCSTDVVELDEGVCLEKYVLAKLADADEHSFKVKFSDGVAECSLSVPLSSKAMLQALDEHGAEKVFREAIKF